MHDPNFGRLVRNFLLEVALYGVLVVAYFLIVLRFLGDWLTEVFKSDLTLYAALAIGLVVVQAVFLDWVTNFLLDLLQIERLE